MRVILAKTAGFCMGVRRAMEMALTQANTFRGPLYTYGPLIHNNQALGLLESKGVKVVKDVTGLSGGRLLIRAHGIPPQERQTLHRASLTLIDATCPKVARVQGILRAQTRKGCTAVILGDKDHAEVVGLMGYSEGPVFVIQGTGDVASLPDLGRIALVAQTTANASTFQEVAAALRARFPDITVFETICDATHQRQEEVRSLAKRVDAVVVVGGFHSGNTRRLVEVAKASGVPTFHVETEKDLREAWFAGMETVGVTAGASTPGWMIKAVVNRLTGMRGRREGAFLRFLRALLNVLVMSNGLVALGAMAFTYACCVLTRQHPCLFFPALTFFYVYAMHVFNRFLSRGATAFNDPERAAFLMRHRKSLLFTACLASATGLTMSLFLGLEPFFLYSAMTVLGILYGIPLLPGLRTYSRIKDIPGSKSLVEALAMVGVIQVIPSMVLVEGFSWPPFLVASALVFLQSLFRSIFFDVLQVQGDLIAGRETLPIVVGEAATMMILRVIFAVCTGLLLLAPLFGLIRPFGLVLLIPLLCLFVCLLAYERGRVLSGIHLEAVIEGTFLLSGLLALLWTALL